MRSMESITMLSAHQLRACLPPVLAHAGPGSGQAGSCRQHLQLRPSRAVRFRSPNQVGGQDLSYPNWLPLFFFLPLFIPVLPSSGPLMPG